jgi:Helix-turn-helix domain
MLFPRSLWKRIRLKAVNEDTTATKLIVKLLEEYIKKRSDKDGVR